MYKFELVCPSVGQLSTEPDNFVWAVKMPPSLFEEWYSGRFPVQAAKKIFTVIRRRLGGGICVCKIAIRAHFPVDDVEHVHPYTAVYTYLCKSELLEPPQTIEKSGTLFVLYHKHTVKEISA